MENKENCFHERSIYQSDSIFWGEMYVDSYGLIERCKIFTQFLTQMYASFRAEANCLKRVYLCDQNGVWVEVECEHPAQAMEFAQHNRDPPGP